MTAVETRSLSKRFRDVTAVDGIDLALDEGRIHGLLGRNGAGKTTLMKLLTGQVFATGGQMRVLGENPVENPAVLARTCFIQESQKYPDGFRAKDVLRIAEGLYPEWDQVFARELVGEFRLPETRAISKLSRGQLSAVGIILGLASRAPLTFFDEPYLGLDAVARRMFFDRLLADFTEHPRTVVLSTHHIDEVSTLLEHVVLLDEGRIAIDEEAETLQTAAIEVSGRAQEVREFVGDADLLHFQELGALASAAVHADRGRAERARAAGLQVAPVSLQNYIVHRTTSAVLGAAVS
ncbi:ABC transporter ATP-binding protein [Brachybacterium saurashtrense]|uniref:ABC transporter ATP-binding protein n=1 Tax=Brachybacterium saurashtrense TaxID=556288 RepID=A0A345YK51_9MICO|nr:ABC transporter ATP-binding protein [Brachybacterium saurashtrense]AXK44303.1 ABC transporter ATP-binding protein [Brachybacterium saurashtrense]RRR21339.1 ABC transporter ATP-binding protein [Brachybacterium saurashtrense]RRR22914.1 ABC transporter ATP-binding protein [Brachybacterium saurashtrense]